MNGKRPRLDTARAMVAAFAVGAPIPPPGFTVPLVISLARLRGIHV